MNNKKLLRVLCFFSLALSMQSRAIDNRQKIGLGAAIVVCGAGIWWLYNYNQEISNEELAERAQSLYDAVHNKHSSITFLYKPGVLEKASEIQLNGLVRHKDIGRLKDVAKDLPQLNRMMRSLRQRMKKDEKDGKSVDEVLVKRYEELENLRGKLRIMANFWKEHASFFALHRFLGELSSRYAQVRTGSVSGLFDFCIHKEADSLNSLSQLISNLKRDVSILRDKADVCERYPMLFGQAGGLIKELNQIEQNMQALICFFKLENEFNRFDAFAQKLSFQDSQDLVAKVKGVYAGKQKYPFTHVAEEANTALSALENRRNAVTGFAVLFAQNDSFSARAYDLLKRADDLTAFLTVLRDKVVSLDEYEKDGKKHRKDKQHEKELVLERERIRKEDERKKEALRIEKKRVAAEEKRVQVEYEKVLREQQTEVYKADQKVREAALARDKTQKEKEIQELKMREAVVNAQAASHKSTTQDQATQTN